MDAVEILLLCAVGISVSVFLIIVHLEERRRKFRSIEIYGCEEEERSVGGDGGTEKQITSEIFFEKAEIEEERENPVSVSCEKSGRENDGEEEEDFIDDDDWEGVERTELEKVFGEAVVFVSRKCDDDDRIHEDLKLELYGLSKIALEGPCYGSQPMALKVTARSKWNAWQKLGNMSRETAMEKYIDILSKAIPGWKVDMNFTISYNLYCIVSWTK
ncbi:acyl-coa-binding domain-containing protein 3 [Phtheirospermum japonicum]|uniref:Acyl-coa-binding domain-containing protein 3 n=1 Tax=Phtheirospermum japonicum TaxID=374723 RepID=A0A830B1Y1_9LAMI|nr:acyl-coa-binding domain-containing protein 3 [Phtheirospermum japonicum]